MRGGFFTLVLDWLLGWLLGGTGSGPGMSGFVLFGVQVVMLVLQLLLVSRARRYRLEAERYAMRSIEAARLVANDILS